jgi:chaperone required for assembly of F1-ATPase
MNARGRFYREVSIGEASKDETGYRVLLDGRPVRTPLGSPLSLSTRALAEAIAEEWRSQGETIRPETMTLTKLANTAIDRIRYAPEEIRSQLVSFAKSDLVCYRAESPAGLVARQTKEWDPLIDWIAAAHGARFHAVTGIVFVNQPQDAITAIESALAARDAFELSALSFAAAALGSAILALALASGRVTPDQAFAASQLDALYQAERWGEDAEAKAARDSVRKDIAAAGRFLRLLEDNND